MTYDTPATSIIILGGGIVGTGLIAQVKNLSVNVETIPLRKFGSLNEILKAKLDSATHVIWAGRDVAFISQPDTNVNDFFHDFLFYLKSRIFPLHVTYISSGGAVYGNAEVFPTPESCVLNPISAYGKGKMLNEFFIQEIAQTNLSLSLLVLRPGNIYSFSENDYSYLSILERAVRSQEGVKTVGGSQTRDFIYVDDFAAAAISLIIKKNSGVFNIGTGISVSLLTAQSILEDFFCTRIKVRYVEASKQDVIRSELDISKLCREIDFEPDSIHTVLKLRFIAK